MNKEARKPKPQAAKQEPAARREEEGKLGDPKEFPGRMKRLTNVRGQKQE